MHSLAVDILAAVAMLIIGAAAGYYYRGRK
jgi:hypothetical protein